jgi:hypothetical protein
MPKWLRKLIELLTGSKARKAVKTAAEVLDLAEEAQRRADLAKTQPSRSRYD